MNNENLKQLKAECKALAKKIEKLEAGSWPQVGDRYYFITTSSGVSTNLWSGDSIDLDRKTIGNIYPTEGKAEAEIMRRKARNAALMKWVMKLKSGCLGHEYGE